jgi:hypothetical protein
MYRSYFNFAPLALLLTLTSNASADDFRNVFDGTSLDGWVVEGPAKGKTGQIMWFVEDGRIVCLGEEFGFLRGQSVRTRGCANQAGRSASSKRQAAQGIRGSSEPQRQSRVPEGPNPRKVTSITSTGASADQFVSKEANAPVVRRPRRNRTRFHARRSRPAHWSAWPWILNPSTALP